MTEQPQGIAEGIYFHLSNEEYHDDPALSHSGMVKVLMSWQDYWKASILNPDRKKYESTDAMKFGERSGMLLLEPEKFHQRFNTYGKTSANAKGTWLSSVEYSKLHESIDAIRDVPAGREYFTHGYAEVSIFWRDPGTGIMLRVKFDWLRTFGAIDFKRIKGLDDWSIGSAVRDQGLDIQHFLYLEGIKAGREMLRRMSDSRVATMAKQQQVNVEWLRAFRDENDLMFRFLFQRSTPPYIWEFRELEPEVVLEGANATDAAIRRYKAGLDSYGINTPPMGDGEVRSISPYHVPRRKYDYA